MVYSHWVHSCINADVLLNFPLFWKTTLQTFFKRRKKRSFTLLPLNIYIETVHSTFFVEEKEHFDNRVNDYMSILRPYSSQKQQQLHPSILVHYKNSFLIGLMNTCVFKHLLFLIWHKKKHQFHFPSLPYQMVSYFLWNIVFQNYLKKKYIKQN